MAQVLISFEEVVRETRIEGQVLQDWIGRKWIRPVEREGRFLFDETDRARVQLIAQLHIDLEVQEDALAIILSLLDQVYELRRTLTDVKAALEHLPEDLRADLEARLGEPPKP